MKEKSRYMQIILPKFFLKAVPLWMVFILILNSSMLVGFLEYYVMKKNFNKAILELSEKTKSPEELVQILKTQVLPQTGYTLSVRWNDIGTQLLKSGVIDQKKYEELFASEPNIKKHMSYLSITSNDHMVINETNARFMVNTLWALGLVNKSKILDEGSMKTVGDGNHMNYASTGGWNLGSKPTETLYSSTSIITLTPEQEELVKKIAQNVYRPCCGNHTEFPDCNHGMAALGYIQTAVKQRIPEKEIYKDLLALNSFWFPQNYVELAAYLQKEGTDWKKVDAKRALSQEFSSAQAAQKIRQGVQGLPGFNSQGGGCAA